MNIPRKRSGSHSKKTKEKYEVLFKNEEIEEINENILTEIINSNINCENFEIDVMKIVNIEQSAIVRKNLNQLIKECIKSLDSGNVVRFISSANWMLIFLFTRQLQKDCKQLKNSWSAVLLHDEEIQWIFTSSAARGRSGGVHENFDSPLQ